MSVLRDLSTGQAFFLGVLVFIGIGLLIGWLDKDKKPPPRKPDDEDIES